MTPSESFGSSNKRGFTVLIRFSTVLIGSAGGIFSGRVLPILEIVFLWDAFTSLNGIYSQSAIESFVSCIMEKAEHFILHTRFSSCARCKKLLTFKKEIQHPCVKLQLHAFDACRIRSLYIHHLVPQILCSI